MAIPMQRKRAAMPYNKKTGSTKYGISMGRKKLAGTRKSGVPSSYGPRSNAQLPKTNVPVPTKPGPRLAGHKSYGP